MGYVVDLDTAKARFERELPGFIEYYRNAQKNAPDAYPERLTEDQWLDEFSTYLFIKMQRRNPE